MTYHDPERHLSLEECERIEELTSKYYTPQMKLDFENAVRFGTAKAKAVKLRDLIDSGGLKVMPDEEMAELHGLQGRFLECKTAELPPDRARAYLDAAENGIIDDPDGLRERAEKARCAELWDRIVEVMRFQPHVRGTVEHYPEVMMTDEDKQAAVDRWHEESAFDRAKAEFQAAYDSADSIEAKADLGARFPEFMGE